MARSAEEVGACGRVGVAVSDLGRSETGCDKISPGCKHCYAERMKGLPVMPLYDSTLRKVMLGGSPLSDALVLFSDILDGVEAAHLQNVIHRDLKPENLLIEMPGRRVVGADFGIAHFEEEDLLTAVETGGAERLANYRYSAPEQRTPQRTVDLRSDIFALGSS